MSFAPGMSSPRPEASQEMTVPEPSPTALKPLAKLPSKVKTKSREKYTDSGVEFFCVAFSDLVFMSAFTDMSILESCGTYGLFSSVADQTKLAEAVLPICLLVVNILPALFL